MKTKAAYNFDEHIIGLSKTNDINKISEEWIECYRRELSTQSGHCICQRKIKHIIYMYNTFTKNFITVGTTCFSKFKGHIKSLKKSILVEIFNQRNTNSEYKLIDDIFIYSENIEQELITHIMNRIKKGGNLEILLINVKELIHEYGMSELVEIYNILELHEKERQEKERQEKERQEKERERQEKERERQEKERERQEKEKERQEKRRQKKERQEEIMNELQRLEQERPEKERQEKERQEKERQEEIMNELQRLIDNVECKCGIKVKNICACEIPKLIPVVLSNNNLYCKCCRKWKCRC